MTGRFCADGHEVPEGMTFCAFGDNVVETYEGETPRDTEPDQPPADVPVARDSAAACWNCGLPATGGPVSAICLRCGKSPTQPQLVLSFPGGDVTLFRGRQVQLGRFPDLPYASLCTEFDNVSRWHATVGVDDTDNPWVRDDKSANGTFVNGCEIRPMVPRQLRDGDSIRLGAELTAEVRFGRISHNS